MSESDVAVKSEPESERVDVVIERLADLVIAGEDSLSIAVADADAENEQMLTPQAPVGDGSEGPQQEIFVAAAEDVADLTEASTQQSSDDEPGSLSDASATGSAFTVSSCSKQEEESLGEGEQLEGKGLEPAGGTSNALESTTEENGTREIKLLSTKSTDLEPFDGTWEKFRLQGDVQFDTREFYVRLCWQTNVKITFGKKAHSFITKPIWITSMRGQTVFRVAVGEGDIPHKLRSAMEKGRATLVFSAIVHGFYWVDLSIAGPGRDQKLKGFTSDVFVSDCVLLHFPAMTHVFTGDANCETFWLYPHEYAQVLQVMHGMAVNVDYMSRQLKIHFSTYFWQHLAYYLTRMIRTGTGGPHCDSRIACALYRRDYKASTSDDNSCSVYARCLQLPDGVMGTLTEDELYEAYAALPSIAKENLEDRSSIEGRVLIRHEFEGRLDIEFFAFHSVRSVFSSRLIGNDLINPKFSHHERKVLHIHPMVRISSPLPRLLFSVQVEQWMHITSLDSPKRIVKHVETHSTCGLGLVDNRNRYVHVELDDFVCVDLARVPARGHRSALQIDANRLRMCVKMIQEGVEDDNGQHFIDQSLLVFNASNEELSPADVQDALKDVGYRAFTTFLLCLYGLAPTTTNTYDAVRGAILLAARLKMVNLLELELLKILKETNMVARNAIATARELEFVKSHNLQTVATYICTHEDYNVFVKLVLGENYLSFKEQLHVL